MATSYKDFLSEHLFSAALERYIICDVCGLRSPSFQSTTVLHITPTYTASIQELIMQDRRLVPLKKKSFGM